jgi:3-oxoadipate enol-lactonase
VERPIILERAFTERFRQADPAAVERAAAMFLAASPDDYIAGCEAIRDMDLREEAVRVSVPTLVIAGSDDVATPPADGRFLASAIAGAAYVELAAAHLSNVEAAARYTAAALSFLHA